MNKGKIVQIIGPVVDAEFTEQLPAIYNALTVEYELDGETAKLTLEVQQHLGDNWVRAVAMSATEGLKRGMDITDNGKPISMPVGEGVMGRVFNVTGDAVDEQGPVQPDKDADGNDIYNPIHRLAPELKDQSTTPQVLSTGIKVIDLICPFLKGGKVGAFGGAGGPVTDETYKSVLAKQYSMTTPGNAMKFGPIHPEPDVYHCAMTADRTH